MTQHLSPAQYRQMAKGDERSIQRGIVQYLKSALPKTVRFFSTQNGLHTSKAQAGKAKAEGMVAGVPDIVLIGQGGAVAFMEVKTDKGRLSPAQVEFSEWCVFNGVEIAVVRSVGDVREFLRALDIQAREAR